MKVKRYFASSMRSALDMIKQEQGPDVLILSNRKVDGGVELITADELTEQEAEQLAARGDAGRQQRADSQPAPATPAAPALSPDALLGDGEQQRDLRCDGKCSSGCTNVECASCEW